MANKNKWYIKQTITRVKRGGNNGLLAVGEIIGDDAQSKAPLEFGELETSMHVDQDKTNLTTYISFSKIVDGVDVATIQHENLSYNHLPGKQAKYLQQPFFQLGPALLGSVLADEIKKVL